MIVFLSNVLHLMFFQFDLKGTVMQIKKVLINEKSTAYVFQKYLEKFAIQLFIILQ